MEVTDFCTSDVAELPSIQPSGWRDIRLSYEYYLSGSHCRPVKISIDGAVAAVGAAIRLERTGWLGHVIVHPERRRQGLGLQIVTYLVDYLRDTGCGTISLVATDDGYPLYERVGFAPIAEYRFFERAQPAANPLESPAVFPAKQGDLEMMLRLDREVTGEGRRVLLADQVSTARVCTDGSKVSGFYCPALGEGFIAALDPAAGTALLEDHLTRADRVALPQANTHGANAILAAGFAETRTSTRMVLGKPFAWRPECVYSRIGGYLG